jgi:Cu/Ag efflux protein CusF
MMSETRWKRRTLGAAVTVLGLLFGVPAGAQGTSQGTAPGASATPAAAPSGAGPQAASKAEAEVRRVEVSTGRIQLRHGPIANLDMPPMTMVFRVKSPALLDGLKEGDRILFTAEKIDGAYTVTSVEKRP